MSRTLRAPLLLLPSGLAAREACPGPEDLAPGLRIADADGRTEVWRPGRAPGTWAAQGIAVLVADAAGRGDAQEMLGLPPDTGIRMVRRREPGGGPQRALP